MQKLILVAALSIDAVIRTAGFSGSAPGMLQLDIWYLLGESFPHVLLSSETHRMVLVLQKR